MWLSTVWVNLLSLESLNGDRGRHACEKNMFRVLIDAFGLVFMATHPCLLEKTCSGLLNVLVQKDNKACICSDADMSQYLTIL